MHFLKRSMSFVRFRVVGKFSFAHDTFQEALEHNQFKNLADIEEAEESVGWVSPENCLQPPLLDYMLIEPYFKLTMRVDRRKIPAALFAAHLAIEERAALASSEKGKLSLKQRKEIKQNVRNFLMQQIFPSSSIYQALWNFRTATCYFFSTSRGVQNKFSKLFTQTFELELEPLTPWSLAEKWANDNNAFDALKTLEPCSFRE